MTWGPLSLNCATEQNANCERIVSRRVMRALTLGYYTISTYDAG
jgi:hypothetical protein